MPDSMRRSLRTLVQVVLGQVAAGGLTSIWNDYLSRHQIDPTITLIVGFILAALISYAQNELEDQGKIPAVLKAQASSGAKPATVDPAK